MMSAPPEGEGRGGGTWASSSPEATVSPLPTSPLRKEECKRKLRAAVNSYSSKLRRRRGRVPIRDSNEPSDLGNGWAAWP